VQRLQGVAVIETHLHACKIRVELSTVPNCTWYCTFGKFIDCVESVVNFSCQYLASTAIIWYNVSSTLDSIVEQKCVEFGIDNAVYTSTGFSVM